ncbi:transcriptional regulator, LuxR family [Moritella sp. PE36]|uniref:response regulator n=1 Tax=Moritella sp. PE36 TaxID=58051 RepID=UPI0001568748|nr:response regulator transcription factor [Moritella sp. PE36]EDM69203.1 transcriptional regulator, LuxR family [Moritella sp. PE36]
MSNIILADDHLIVAQGIASILQPEHQILAIAKDGLELVELVKQHQPDLVITDISMPDMTGIAAIAALKRINKHLKIICLTMHDEQEYAEGAIAAGAKGYVLKHEASESLIEAVNQVLNGGTYISTSITVDPDKPKLSSRQISVLQLLAQGKSARQVADELFISPRTVEFHKYSIMKLVNAKTSAELIQYALNHGLMD